MGGASNFCFCSIPLVYMIFSPFDDNVLEFSNLLLFCYAVIAYIFTNLKLFEILQDFIWALLIWVVASK